MSTRLELAEQKLARLKNEFASKKSPMDGAPLGQPIVMNSSGKRMARKLQKHQETMFNKLDAIAWGHFSKDYNERSNIPKELVDEIFRKFLEYENKMEASK